MFKRFLLLIYFFASAQAAVIDFKIENENSNLIQDVINNIPELNLKDLVVKLENNQEIENLSNFKDFFCTKSGNTLLINQEQFNTLTRDEKAFAISLALLSKKKFSIDRDDSITTSLSLALAVAWYIVITIFNLDFSIINSTNLSVVSALEPPLSLPIFLADFTIKIAAYICLPLLIGGVVKISRDIIIDLLNNHELKNQDIKAARFVQNFQAGVNFLKKRKDKIEDFIKTMRAMKDDIKSDLKSEISFISERIKNLENQA